MKWLPYGVHAEDYNYTFEQDRLGLLHLGCPREVVAALLRWLLILMSHCTHHESWVITLFLMCRLSWDLVT